MLFNSLPLQITKSSYLREKTVYWHKGKIIRLEKDGFGVIAIGDRAEQRSFFSARNVKNPYTLAKIHPGAAVKVGVSDESSTVWPAEVVEIL